VFSDTCNSFYLIMGIARFTSLYDTEEKCILLIKKWRLNEGVKCRRCESTKHYWLATRLRFRCANCRWETTLRSGTALEYSKLSYRDWVHTLLVLTDSKKPVSAAHLQRILHMKYYVPAWSMLHKIRYAMGQSMKAQNGSGWLVAETGSVPVLSMVKLESTQKIRAMVQSWKVFLEVESRSSDGPKEKSFVSESDLYTRIRVRAQLCDLMPPVFRVGLASTWVPGLIRSSETVKNVGPLHDSDIDSLMKRDHEGALNWLGIMWVNARRNFHGVYHNISDKYIQNYLSEFSFLTNHRYLGAQKFDALISLILRQTWFLPLVQASVYSGKALLGTGP
jgi:transposase-like protein